MGAGLAKQFRVRYPAAYKWYKEFTESGGWDVGTDIKIESSYGFTVLKNVCLHYYCYPNDGLIIINLPTKDKWRNKSHIEMIKTSVLHLGILSRIGIESIALPRLGCGLGGLKREDVRPILISELQPLDARFEVWSL